MAASALLGPEVKHLCEHAECEAEALRDRLAAAEGELARLRGGAVPDGVSRPACCQQWPWLLLALCVISFGFGVAVGRSTTDAPDAEDIWIMDVRNPREDYVGTLLAVGPPEAVEGGFRYRDLNGETRYFWERDGDYTYPTRCLPPGWSEGGGGDG